LFVSPWLAGFVLLTLYPILATLYWSFCRVDMLNPPEPVGWENYERLAADLVAGERFGQAVWNTAYYALLSVPLSIAVGLGLALMLAWNVRGQAVYRTVLFLPSVVPVVATSALWMWLLEPDDGLVNYLLSLVGLPGGNWLKGIGETAWPPGWQTAGVFGSKDALVLMALWGVGNFMIIYLAALGDVPEQLYEAAQLDGAGPLRRFRHITLPLLTPVIFFNLIMGIIQSVQAFTQIYIVSEGTGGPVGSTLVLSLHIFLAAFRDLEMGYASAMAWVLFVFVTLLTLLVFRTSRHWVFYQ
jgi:multiple sugar transport system permease protein